MCLAQAEGHTAQRNLPARGTTTPNSYLPHTASMWHGMDRGRNGYNNAKTTIKLKVGDKLTKGLCTNRQTIANR